ILSERAGRRAFGVWARLIRLAGPAGAWTRLPLLALFCAYLVAMIVVVMPPSLLAQRLFSGR
ncbi:MAG TPA: dialkylresorcinol condensing enzyme, partial [Burkholderiales bacterium]|nr:dialkylresorcinol condensing enzyme [Burkholderiales bacterium]